MLRVLCSWIGNTDLRAARGEESAGRGPIGQALEKLEFDEVVLLSNYPKQQVDPFRKWVKGLTGAKLVVEQVSLDDPTDFTAVYQLADDALTRLKARCEKARRRLGLTLHLSPGTPVMTAVWVILGKTRHPATLIQTSKERGLQTTSVPLDIAAEFVELIPTLLRGPDAALEARSAGTRPEAPSFGDVVYRCAAMEDVVSRARKVAPRGVSVLIEGESGTGKELLARAIHEAGPRRERPFVGVNCGALPKDLVESQLFGHKKGAFTGAVADAKGYFREAQGGTLFLDEVGELPLDAQVKLLRALQDKQVVAVGETRAKAVDVRIIAATNRNLAAECQAGRFRQDLFYRLAIAVLRVPPLRERKGDLGLLVDALLLRANDTGAREEPGYKRKVLSAGARNLLLNHGWPGNVRELENTLMRATVWTEGSTIREQDARAALLGAGASEIGAVASRPLGDGFELDALLADISREYVRRALKESNGNKSQAAELLGLGSRQTLNNRMKSLGISE